MTIPNSEQNGTSRLARMEAYMQDIKERLERIEKKIDYCPVTAHSAYFKVMAGAIVVLATGVVALFVKVIG